MNILVLLKQTFDTEERIVIDNGNINEDGVEFIINPYDEYAVEEAVKIKEDMGAEVTVLTVGPDRAKNALLTALAMGADKGIFVELEDIDVDEYFLAKIITATIKGEEYQLILGGNMAIDSGAGQVALRVAEILGIPHIAAITKLTIEGDKSIMERDMEGDIVTFEVNLPVLASAQQGLNEPRYPSLPGIMKAKKKPIKRLSVDELDLPEEEFAPRTSIRNQYVPERKKSTRVLEGEIPQQVSELVNVLRTEAKVI